jgi:hypothetical protein
MFPEETATVPNLVAAASDNEAFLFAGQPSVSLLTTLDF